jgi:hypothetical protein
MTVSRPEPAPTLFSIEFLPPPTTSPIILPKSFSASNIVNPSWLMLMIARYTQNLLSF